LGGRRLEHLELAAAEDPLPEEKAREAATGGTTAELADQNGRASSMRWRPTAMWIEHDSRQNGLASGF
jgi:hypothetical protein